MIQIKTIERRKYASLLLISIVLLLVSCSPPADEEVKADKIPESGKAKITELRKSIDENSNPVLFMFKERKKYKL